MRAILLWLQRTPAAVLPVRPAEESSPLPPETSEEAAAWASWKGKDREQTLEEVRALKALALTKHAQFFENHPPLADPLVREQYQRLGPGYLRNSPGAHTSSKMFSASATNGDIRTMFYFDDLIARCDKRESELMRTEPPEENRGVSAEVRGLEPGQTESGTTERTEQLISGLARITATSSHTIAGVSQEETATNCAEQAERREGAANSGPKTPGRPKGKFKPETLAILKAWVSLGRPQVVGIETCDRIAEKLMGAEKPKTGPRLGKLRARIRSTISRYRSLSDSTLNRILEKLPEGARASSGDSPLSRPTSGTKILLVPVLIFHLFLVPRYGLILHV
jgi:hypothetical protein